MEQPKTSTTFTFSENEFQIVSIALQNYANLIQHINHSRKIWLLRKHLAEEYVKQNPSLFEDVRE